MLCCGILTLLAALVVGLRRRLRVMPKAVLSAGGAVLLALPVLALAAIDEPGRMSRADVIERAMYSLCGRPLE
jgi:hypothetical protein